MQKKFEGAVFVSNENGIKFDVEDPLTAKMLSNPEKKSLVRLERAEKKAAKGGKGAKAATKHDNDDEVEQEIK